MTALWNYCNRTPPGCPGIPTTPLSAPEPLFETAVLARARAQALVLVLVGLLVRPAGPRAARAQAVVDRRLGSWSCQNRTPPVHPHRSTIYQWFGELELQTVEAAAARKLGVHRLERALALPPAASATARLPKAAAEADRRTGLL